MTLLLEMDQKKAFDLAVSLDVPSPFLFFYFPFLPSCRKKHMFWFVSLYSTCIYIHIYVYIYLSISLLDIWATDEITCLGKMPSPNVRGPLSILQLLNMDYGVPVLGVPHHFEGSLSCFKVQSNLLLCSSTNFVSYSYRHTERDRTTWHATPSHLA